MADAVRMARPMTNTTRQPVFADEATGPFHHIIISQADGTLKDGKVYVPSILNGNLRAYGLIVPGTVVVLPEYRRPLGGVMVPLDPSLQPLLLRGFTSRNVLKRSLAYARARSTIRRLVSQASFVQIQHVSAIGFLAGLGAIASDTPFYMDIGGSLRDPPGVFVRRPWHQRLARIYYCRVEKRIAEHAKLVLAVSAHLHRTLSASDAPKAVVWWSYINEKDIIVRDGACDDAGCTLFVATRMIESKGLQDLIRAMRILIDEKQAMTLKIAGVGDYLPALKNLRKELHLEANVEFLGGIPVGDELWSHYRQADIVVLPSRGHYEGTPRMIIEAWAAGAPVIATTVGGIPDMLNHEEDGLLIAPGDVPVLASAIKRVRSDARLRSRLVMNGYSRAREMTLDGRIRLLRRVLREHLPGLLPDAA